MKMIIPKEKTIKKFSHTRLVNQLVKAIVFKAKLNIYIEKISDKLFNDQKTS